jgi:hypothetical protein
MNKRISRSDEEHPHHPVLVCAGQEQREGMGEGRLECSRPELEGKYPLPLDKCGRRDRVAECEFPSGSRSVGWTPMADFEFGKGETPSLAYR